MKIKYRAIAKKNNANKIFNAVVDIPLFMN